MKTPEEILSKYYNSKREYPDTYSESEVLYVMEEYANQFKSKYRKYLIKPDRILQSTFNERLTNDNLTDEKAEELLSKFPDLIKHFNIIENDMGVFFKELEKIVELKKEHFLRYRNQFIKTNIPFSQTIEHWKEIEKDCDWYKELIK